MVAENDQIRLEITKPVYKRPYELNWASQVALVERTCLPMQETLRHMSSIPGSGRSPGGGHGNSL